MTEDASARGRRPVRSFVRREGRLTPAQSRALEELWPRFGVEFTDESLGLDALFGRRAPRRLEIGFGNGDLLLWLAGDHPNVDFIGVEVHRPGVGRMLRHLDERDLTNVRVICHDAVDVLTRQIPPGALNELMLMFPDPWPKKRHHKRRIVQPEFVRLVARVLEPGGHFRLATDWENYADQMLEVLGASREFEPVAMQHNGAAERPETRFERRGRRLGHDVWDLLYRRVTTP